MSNDLEARIVELEIRYSHQEHLLEQLNEVVREQRDLIDRLSHAIDDLRATQASDGEAPPNEPPPHY